MLSTGVAVGLLVGVLGMPDTAFGEGLPVSPSAQSTRERWINPNVREIDAEGDLRIELTQVPTSVELGSPLSLRARVINDSDESLNADNLRILIAHADSEDSLGQSREVLAADPSAYPYRATPVKLNGVIRPGEAKEISLEVATSEQRDGLRLKSAGVYPVMVALESSSEGIVSTQRFLSAVRSGDEEEQERTPLSVLVPLSAPIDAVGGETGDAPEPSELLLQSEDLAHNFGPGGHLGQTLNDFDAFATAYPQAAQGTCLGIDPELVRTAARMSQGYKVAQERPSVVSQKQRLRDSWGSGGTDIQSTEGTGQEIAAQWLNHLRELAGRSCTVALPWANADLDAVQATNNEWLMREALQRGQITLSNVLGSEPLDNVVVPGKGYISPPSVSSMGWADKASIPQSSTLDPLGKAWFDQGEQNPAPEPENTSDSALEQTRTQAPSNVPPRPQQPVRVLMADNTIWAAPRSGDTALLGPNIWAKTYPGSLAALLADASATPETKGYSNYNTRFDARLDAGPARLATASAAIEFEAQRSEDPVLVMLPINASSPKTLLNTVGELVERGDAESITLDRYVALDPDVTQELEAQPMPEPPGFGAPFDDPTVISDTEISRARQQADYIDDLTQLMVPDPAVAIGPYSFTVPLRMDVLRALSSNGRGSIATFDQTVQRENALLNQNRETLTELRSSVTLLPPGNVYTRWSDSSPLLIAARNGLPLPVDARILYDAPKGASINVEERLLIPAKGSITAQMTATLPTDSGRTDIDLWLATPSGAAISNPVTIGVQTRSGIIGSKLSTVLIMLALVGLVFLGVIRRRRAKRRVQRFDASKRAPRPPQRYAQSTRYIAHPKSQRRPRREEGEGH